MLQYARENFGCDTLNGVELENVGGSGTAGSHWKKLFYFDDFMNGSFVFKLINAISWLLNEEET